MSTAVAMSLYFLPGLGVFLLVDRKFMSARIPYGDFPSGIPLHKIRLSLLMMLTLFGVPLFIYGLAKAFIQGASEVVITDNSK